MTTLTLGCLFSDRVEALVDGRVGIEGVELDVRFVEAQRLFRETLRDRTYDLAELSIASHIAAIGRGDRSYVGLPVFLSRSFRHANVYVRTDRVASPSDLAGRRIGLVDWQQTAALWVRGLLADDHGVDRHGVDWVTAGLHEPVLDDRVPFAAPAGIAVRRSPSTLDAMLSSGEIDAVVSPGEPRCLREGRAPVARLWPDALDAEVGYWQRTGCFPIMHLLVARRALLDARPCLASHIYQAFDRARALAAADLDRRDFPKVALPWLRTFTADARDRLGGDPWTYGVEANRPTLTRLLRYAAQDGLIPNGSAPEDLFA